MSVTINIPDTLRKQVESASSGQNTVLYTQKGNPSYFFIQPQRTLESFNGLNLGTGVHPAFIVDGVTKSEIFIGLYPGVEKDNEILSLPHKDPVNSISFTNANTRVRACGPGFHAMTNAEWNLLQCLAIEKKLYPRGNTQHGRSNVDTNELGRRADNLVVTGSAQGTHGRTLTGSGPMSWRHNNTPFGISDITGNVWEWTYGLRIVAGEIQIIPDNNAASASADFSSSSAQWRAINGATGELVFPGTANTVKFAAATGEPYSISTATRFELIASNGTQSLNATALRRLRLASVFSIIGIGDDRLYVSLSGERMPCRGGTWDIGSDAGLFSINLNFLSGNTNINRSVRPGYVA